MNRRVIALFGVGGVVATVLPLCCQATPALVWNTTASAPVGLYLNRPDGRSVVGDWVLVRPPIALAASLASAGFLPVGALLVKRIAALAPSIVCRAGLRIDVDGRVAALALENDRFGRPLPRWRGCRRLGASEVFLLNADPRSLDSRYFGPLSTHQIIGRAAPLWINGASFDAR